MGSELGKRKGNCAGVYRIERKQRDQRGEVSVMPKNISVLKHILRNSQARSGKLGIYDQETKYIYFFRIKGHGTAP